MSLLSDITTASLDPGYAEATRARRAAGEPAGTLRGSPVLLVGLLLVGALLATAASQVRARASVTETARAALITEVRHRTAANDRLARQVAALRVSTTRTRDDGLSLTSEGAALTARLRRLEAATGAAGVSGPGLVVTVRDAPGAAEDAADPRQRKQQESGRVRDSDLQRVVNGLWEAGAAGIAVNGQRLTALSAIRSAGDAVLVAYHQLAPPYVVAAVGDPVALHRAFRAGAAAAYLHELDTTYGITSSVREDSSLALPAATSLTLRHATPRRRPAPQAAVPTPGTRP